MAKADGCRSKGRIFTAVTLGQKFPAPGGSLLGFQHQSKSAVADETPVTTKTNVRTFLDGKNAAKAPKLPAKGTCPKRTSPLFLTSIP
jgi:hypothetical protein